MNVVAIAASALLIALASGAAGVWWGYHAGQDHCIAEQARDTAVAEIAADSAASAAAVAIAAITVRHTTVIQQVQHDVIEKPIYRDCRSGDDAVRLFNSTIEGAGTTGGSAGGGELPQADAPAR